MDPALARMNFFNLPTPYVLGFDFSGEVVELGGEGGGLRVGDRVFGKTGAGGCFAGYIVTKQENALPRGAVPAAEASTFGIAFLTAYESLVIKGALQPHAGDRHKERWIYVAGAAGGVGHFAAQIAKICELKVIGSAGKAASLDLLRKLRVDHIIDYSKQDVAGEIMRVTGGKGVDIVYDSTYSAASHTQSAAVIAAGGDYIRLGTAAQMARVGAADVTAVVEGRGAKMIIGDLGRYSADPVYQAQTSRLMDGLKQAVSWYEEGKLKPVITQTVPFDAAALQQTFEGFGTNNVGKVVVRCDARS